MEKEARMPTFNATRQQREMFLVKLPAFLAREWLKQPSGAEVGHISVPTSNLKRKREDQQQFKRPKNSPFFNAKVTTNPTGNTSSTFRGKLSEGTHGIKDYHIMEQPIDNPSYCISEDLNTGNITVEGTIVNRWNLQPAVSNEYRFLMGKRVKAEEEKKKERTLVKIDDTAPPQTAPTMGRISVPKKEEPKDKMTRMNRSDLLAILFSAFTRQQFWTFPALRELTQQPQAYLKEILGEFCTFHKKGPQKNQYEMKPEYDTRKPATDTS